MVQTSSRLICADNTGAKQLMCIRVLGGTRKRYARLGDVIIASVKEANPNSQVKKGKSCVQLLYVLPKGIVARTVHTSSLIKTPRY